MTGWIVSVCGLALITVLCDVIVPDGNTKKYIRTVIGIVLSFTILLPIAGFFETDFVVGSSQNAEIAIQQDFLEGITAQKQLARVQKVQKVIDDIGIECSSVTIESNDYVLVVIRCDKQELVALQTAFSKFEDKIMIAWSNIGE